MNRRCRGLAVVTLVGLVSPVVLAACTTDFTIGSGRSDGGSDPAPDGPEQSRADAGGGRRRIDCSGSSCECPANQACELDCPGITVCAPVCAPGSDCVVNCALGACESTCQANASCSINCSVGSCTTDCQGRCAVQCSLGACECTGAGCP